MKTGILAAAALLAGLQGAVAQTTHRMGVLFGFAGPFESLVLPMADAAELAMREASESGLFLGGARIEPVRADSTCLDAAVAIAAAEQLVTAHDVVALVGADCSGVTTAIINSVTAPNGVPMISPSATSPALSTIKDRGGFFRTAPSDIRQGDVLARATIDRGITEVAVTYTNNDYGKGLSESFHAAYKALGGSVSLASSHEDGKADYTAEVATLSASGADFLIVIGYADQGGKGIIQAALDLGAFDSFGMADSMLAAPLAEHFGDQIAGSYATAPGSQSENAQAFADYAEANDVLLNGPFRHESYDAAALPILAAQAAGSAARSDIQSKVLDVANAPGERIGPGEIARGLALLAARADIDYQGATDVEMNAAGDPFGAYLEHEVQDGKWVALRQL